MPDTRQLGDMKIPTLPRLDAADVAKPLLDLEAEAMVRAAANYNNATTSLADEVRNWTHKLQSASSSHSSAAPRQEKPSPIRASALYVSPIAEHGTQRDVVSALSVFGEIKSVQLKPHVDSVGGLQFALVTFRRQSELEACLRKTAEKGVVICGKTAFISGNAAIPGGDDRRPPPSKRKQATTQRPRDAERDGVKPKAKRKPDTNRLTKKRARFQDIQAKRAKELVKKKQDEAALRKVC